MTPLLDRARALWTGLADAPVTFPAEGRITAVTSPSSRMCPAGWAGLVVLGGAGIATVPHDGLIPVLEGLPVEAAASPPLLRTHVDAELLGPAYLSYLDVAEFRPVPGDVSRLGDDDLEAFIAGAPTEDAEESGLADITSAAYAVRDGDRVLAVAGYRRWPHDTAHMSVLTAPGARGRGLARVAASAAVTAALAGGLLPQWRARPEPSRRVAAALGFRELGAQVSLRFG